MKRTDGQASDIVTLDDIKAWYIDNPLPPSKVETYFPKMEGSGDNWHTMSNKGVSKNIASSPIDVNSKVPVGGREGFQDVFGNFIGFGRGMEMDGKAIAQFAQFKEKVNKMTEITAGDARKLESYYADDLTALRASQNAFISAVCWGLLSNACKYDFTVANSPYAQGMQALQYPIKAYQKDNVTTEWSNPTALILNDIMGVVDLGLEHSKNYNTIFVNKRTAMYIRNNAQIQKYCQSLVSNLLETTSRPTIAAINTMLSTALDTPIRIEVIDELVTAEGVNTQVTDYPFADGVAVFTQGGVLGHFEWKPLPIVEPALEYQQDFYVMGAVKSVNPSMLEFYTKGEGFGVVDTFADNMYLRVDGQAWA